MQSLATTQLKNLWVKNKDWSRVLCLYFDYVIKYLVKQLSVCDSSSVVVGGKSILRLINYMQHMGQLS